MIQVQTSVPSPSSDHRRDGRRIIVMGVAGCGKSTLAQQLADALKLTFIEGDQFHPPENNHKMSQGVALDDTDREGWLDRLGVELLSYPGGAVLACSALKRAYRARLRDAVQQLSFVHLSVTQELANARVQARFGGHPFPSSLVASQFATLEDPRGEEHVLQLDGAIAPSVLCAKTIKWIEAQGFQSNAK
jgi:gluconokinase